MDNDHPLAENPPPGDSSSQSSEDTSDLTNSSPAKADQNLIELGKSKTSNSHSHSSQNEVKDLKPMYSDVASGRSTTAIAHYDLRPLGHLVQSRKVTFYLYVANDIQVNQVGILFSFLKEFIPLHLVPGVKGRSLWWLTYEFFFDISRDHVSYNYGLLTKGSASKFPLLGRLFNKDPTEHYEAGKRFIESDIQHDTFHFVEDRHYHTETTSSGVLFYIDWLLQHVNSSSIKEILVQVENLKIKQLPLKYVKPALDWTLDKATSPYVNDVHRLYLCLVMGLLAHVNYPYTPLRIPDTKKANNSIDRLLQSLNTCAGDSELLTTSNCKLLGRIATVLVERSSSPGWLTLAAHFYPYLGVSRVTRIEMAAWKYDNKDYWEMVDLLLSSVTVREDETTIHQQLLLKILESASDQDVAADLFQRPTTDQFFSSEAEKEEFIVKAYQKILFGNGKSVDSGKTLVDLMKVPENVRRRLNRVHSSLLDFAKSSKKTEEEHIEAFFQLITSSGCLSTDQVSSVLKELSKSKSVPHHGLLLEYLCNKQCEACWREIKYPQKLDICSSWVTRKVLNELSQQRKAGKTKLVYESIDELVSCPLNVPNEKLARELCSKAAKELLKNEDSTHILETFCDVKECSDVIRECYRNHIKTMMESQPELARGFVKVLNQYPHSRFRQNLLSCVLDVMDIPVFKDGQRREDCFKKMLEWCLVWSILLSAGKGCFEKSKKFTAAKQIWHELRNCINQGDLSLEFLKGIQQQEEELADICAILEVQSCSGSDDEAYWRKKYRKRIVELSKAEEDCSKKFSLLKDVIKYGKKVSEGINGVSVLVLQFNERNESWQCKKVCELSDDTFWGPLFPLLNPAVSLKPLMESVSFLNIARRCLQESFDQDPKNVEDAEHTEISDFYSLMELLTGEAIERLQAQWNPVFRDPGTLTMETMKTLLGNLKDEEKLEKELAILGDYFNRRFPDSVKVYIRDYVKYPIVMKQVKHVIGVLKTFGLLDLMDEAASCLALFEKSIEDNSALSLRDLHESMGTVLPTVSACTEEEVDAVLGELDRSRELLAFIEEIVDEDIRFLIDAVEEHSDQFVSESSVSDLIDVHGFLAPLIRRRQQGYEAKQFLYDLKESCLAHRGMAVKVQQCSTNVNSLRGLYTSVANRGEITKEIIARCLKKGVYIVSLSEHGVCEAKMSYLYEEDEKKKGESANYSLPDLHDLRSRAHLIVNSDKNTPKQAIDSDIKEDAEEINFRDFIKQVDLLTEITILLSKLRSSGYIKYRKFWKRMRSTDDETGLEKTKDELMEDLETWDTILSSARKKYYFLNYYRSDQLCVLYDFLAGRSKVNYEDVLSLIHFVDPDIKKGQLEKYREKHPLTVLNKSNNDDHPESMVNVIGNTLDELFCHLSPRKRYINVDQEQDQEQSASTHHSRFDVTVKPGELFVACLEDESPLTANVMLTLYENTWNVFPEPYQVVFCGPQTTWEEIQLLLERCFAESKHLGHSSLFCLANVELLANEVQFQLVNAIKEKQTETDDLDGSSQDNKNYRLALICRGGDHHHIVQQFAQYSHHVAGMSDLALSKRLRFEWPEVKMVTSTLPGLGKSERIKKDVVQKKMNVVTFSVSGPLDDRKLIQRLKSLRLERYQCLHFDIGEVSDPLWLGTFLFQLIVTGMVSSGTQFYHLATTHVFIEIANTLKDWLRESLVICKYFTRVYLQWNNYDDLIVSSEITSDLQVVCHYFYAFDRAGLDSTDIHFSGPQQVKPLTAGRCRQLLAKYYPSDADITFTALNTFLGVLADQLLKFSRSAFFKIANLRSMLGKRAQGVRSNLFQALLNVSKEFASRSITTCRSSALSQKEAAEALDNAVFSSGKSAQHMVERVEGMIQWEDSNHLLVVFHGTSSQAIAAVYRNKALVPNNVQRLLKSQIVRGKIKELEDFKTMSQEQLQEKLEKIVRTSKPMKESTANLFSSYALTPDNMLKMILIILRVRVNAPVVIMGETGCGKTSLVRYLANTCQIPFFTFNFHAGITEDQIIEFFTKKENEARNTGKQTWVFLDEINTCDHLGLISDVMCHHTLLGRQLSKKLVFLAACNPYKLRPKEQIQTAGLQGKNIADEYSGLVYRVHPLPEAMIDYVWDYGSLAPSDEKAYIQRMVRTLPKKYEGMLVDLLAESQKFIREAEKNHFCVSLRDVHRCIVLISWFKEVADKRKELKAKKDDRNPKHLRRYQSMAEKYENIPVVKSIVLALAHCYQSRLPTAELRTSYRRRMMMLFSANGKMMNTDGEIDSFTAIVRMEEEDYLDRMELPPGTARNAALRENVFVMLVCILNRIPVFVVGKPGCSKSLSIQLIRSNLRGRDSRDPLFRRLPQLYVVSYQGSESSTSEGIFKVFEKARKYKSHNRDGNVLPVVLLDEVGLAENSKYNPLKVLHSLLEPGDGQVPDVAVVGISNWSLDAAKMNRAIHLSRPEPTIEDLYETGHSLHYADSKDKGEVCQNIGDELRCLAEAYFEYQSQQKHANFHGLRDYYSLIKSLSLSENSDFQQINMALQRNFGGIPGELTNIKKVFLDKLKKHALLSGDDVIPITKLIRENLADPRARHLMLITSGDSAIGILKQTLTQLKRETITIFGSRFEEDLSEDYNYRILSRIILCMERDCILILRDLESIYGSLYDMLNQNYAVVGKRKNCRVALGAYSNPMCHVNDGFRCVVLTDHHKVDFSDPPFLNRFEKQVLRFSDVLNETQQAVIRELQLWVRQVTTVQGLESHFKESDMFIGFYDDTLPSLVLLHGQDKKASKEEIIEKCKDDLMWIASPDGVLRAWKCNRMKADSQEIRQLSNRYFQKPVHQGFATFMSSVMSGQESSLKGDEVGSKTIVMTFSNIHTDISKCLGNTVKCQAERLGAYKSEKHLSERLNHFWTTAHEELLILQCNPEKDAEHMLLARSIIEEKRNSFEKYFKEEEPSVTAKKHVCIIVHVRRGATTENIPWQFSFLCGWKQVFLDVLEAPIVSLDLIRTESVHELLTSSIWPLRRIAQNDLLWCFTCIKYSRRQRPLDSILHIVKNFFRSEKVCCVIEQLVLQWVTAHSDEKDDEPAGISEGWQVKVACDRQALINSSTLYCAMEQFVSLLVRQPLAKIIYFLEKENAWPPHVHDQSGDQLEDMWCDLMSRDGIFNMCDIPEPLGAESYVLDSTSLELHLPFSQVIIRRINAVKGLFLEDYTQVKQFDGNLDETGRLRQNVQLQQLRRYCEIISRVVPEMSEFPDNCRDIYMADLFDITTIDFSAELTRFQRVSSAKAMFMSTVDQSLHVKKTLEFCVQLHIFVWIYEERMLDQLRMVDGCRPFVDSHVLDQLAEKYLQSSQATLTDSNERPTENENENVQSESEKLNRGDTRGRKEGSQVFESTEDDEEQSEESSHSEVDGTGHFAMEPTDQVVETNNNETTFDDLEPASQEILQTHEEEADNINYEDEESEEEREKYEDLLVTAYCEEMLPSQEVVEEQNGGPESWVRNACLLLSLAFKISDQTPAFHFLRLCVDFAKIVLTSPSQTKYTVYPLYILNDIGNAVKPYYLDEEDSFQRITEKLIKPLEAHLKDEAAKQGALQKFSALFYGRCLDTNVDTSGARPIVEQVLSLNQAELVLTMSPVILRLLIVEEMQLPGVFADLISNPGLIEKCPCLKNIDEVFKELSLDGLIHHDSYAAVMVCDLIQPLLNFENGVKIEDIDSSDSELLRTVNDANNVLFKSGHDYSGLVLLSAVAFLRAFFTMLSSFIAGKESVVKGDGPYSHIMMEINSVLCASNASRPSLQLFFLKQLYQHMSLFDLRKLCRDSDSLPAIKNAWDNKKTIEKAEFVFVSKLPEYQEVKAAYWKLTNDDDTAMAAFLSRCQTSQNHRLALLGILVNMIYLKRATKMLTDKEEQLVDWFSEKFAQSTSPLVELLLRIIGRKDFHCPQMQLSPESTVAEVDTALLVLHITCVIACGDKKPPLYEYLSDLKRSKNSFVLAHGEDRMLRAHEKPQDSNPQPFFNCNSCALRIMFKDGQNEKRCPRCGERVDPTAKTNGCSAEATPSNQSSLLESTDRQAWDVCTKNLEPSVYRALHLIVHATLYAGVALGVTSQEDLSALLSKLNVTESQSSSSKKRCPAAAQLCFDHVVNDLSCLTTILSCRREVAVKVMHLVVEKCSKLIQGTSLGKNTCSSREEQQEWEEEFSRVAEKVLPEALGSYQGLKEASRMQKNEETAASCSLEDQLEELDEYPADPKEQDRLLKRLFRVTRRPTLEGFRATFINSPKHLQRKHGFLSLFFAKFDQLLLIGNLSHLLKWSRLVASALTHRISRKDAQSKSINDFISGHLLEVNRSTDERERQKVLFDNFKKAWKAMRPLVNRQLDKEEDEMPHLRETDHVAFCLTESDYGFYLVTAIKILVSLQNAILDEMISLSALDRHPALPFLEKSDTCSGIPSISLQEASGKEIIDFHWSDELFKYAQNSPDYGKGEEISYDFERMEIELASELAFGKRYLTGTLNKFIFSKELFHSCGPLLTEIRKLFPQSATLPEDVRQGLSSLKERRIKAAQDLLQHIEVLMFVLKLKLKNIDVEMSLEVFAEYWLSMLPSPFPVSLLPQPRSSIKLKHITALYEALEDMLADGAIEGLPDQFRAELSDEIRDKVDCLVGKENGCFKLQMLLSALRRFVFRYLSSEKFLPNEKDTLSSRLKESSLWPPAEPPDLQAIPKELALESIHCTITHLQELEKERKANGRLGGRHFQRPTPVVSNKQGGRNKRRVSKFSRS